MAVEVVTKRWGNSLGVVIPSETVEKLGIKPDESIVIEVTKKEHVLKDLFGSVSFKKPTEQLIRESKEELKSPWLK